MTAEQLRIAKLDLPMLGLPAWHQHLVMQAILIPLSHGQLSSQEFVFDMLTHFAEALVEP